MNNQPRGELVPGGLAMVIGSRADSRNIGKVVTLEKFLPAGSEFKAGRVRVDAWQVSGERLSYLRNGVREVSSIGVFAPEHLLPVKPSADPLEITQQQEFEV